MAPADRPFDRMDAQHLSPGGGGGALPARGDFPHVVEFSLCLSPPSRRRRMSSFLGSSHPAAVEPVFSLHLAARLVLAPLGTAIQKRAYSLFLLHSHIGAFLRASKGKRAGAALRCRYRDAVHGYLPRPPSRTVGVPMKSSSRFTATLRGPFSWSDTPLPLVWVMCVCVCVGTDDQDRENRTLGSRRT